MLLAYTGLAFYAERAKLLLATVYIHVLGSTVLVGNP